MKVVFSTFMVLLLYLPVLSQEYGYKHYTIKDGLPQSQVTALYQDNKGFLWIGTKMGLSRFDGHEFQNFYQKDGLLSDFICRFMEVESIGLYILTKKGFCLYRKDSIISFPILGNIPIHWKTSILYHNGFIYFEATNKLYRFNVQNHVENAAKHGLKYRDNYGILTIVVKRKDPFIQIFIRDNGVGRKRAKEIGEESTGKGLKTLQEFYTLFNQFNEHQMKHVIEDLYDGNGNAAGTKVRIDIPLDYRYDF